jgi:hypothetical protein
MCPTCPRRPRRHTRTHSRITLTVLQRTIYGSSGCMVICSRYKDNERPCSRWERALVDFADPSLEVVPDVGSR